MNLLYFFAILLLTKLIMLFCSGAKVELIEDEETQEEDENMVNQIEVIEDTITEEEDMAKALALSKTYFWRKMVERWHCSEETLNKKLLYVKDKVRSMKELIGICENWKMMALAADAYVKNWKESKEILSEKPRFLLKQWTKKQNPDQNLELQMSSAMAAIVLICQEMLLKGSKGDEYFRNIEIKLENKDACVCTEPKIIDFKDANLNKLTYEETNEEGVKRNYLEEFKSAINGILTLMDGDKIVTERENQLEIVKYAHAEYEKMWPLVPEIGIELNDLCAAEQTIFDQGTKIIRVYPSSIQEFSSFINEDLKMFTGISDKRQIKFYAKLLAFTAKMCQIWVYQAVKKKHPKEVEQIIGKKLKDPCEEAKFRVKKMKTKSNDDQPNTDIHGQEGKIGKNKQLEEIRMGVEDLNSKGQKDKEVERSD